MLCPIDFRYGKKEMKTIFDEESKLQFLLDVEGALAIAQAELGIIPKESAKIISEKANTKFVKKERVKEIESEIKHDIMAIIKALSEQCGESGKYIHFGATSYDIVDTANALQFKKAIKIIKNDLLNLRNSLMKLAKRHKNTIMVGRTHGQFALPITFGLKLSVFAMEVQRHYERLEEGEKRICVGKTSGAVGSYAGFGEKAFAVEEKVMKKLGLGIELASSQIVQRDRYIELICILANICNSAEKFATEIRNLQRSEIKEVEEYFDIKTQVGSSTMAQKKNPINSEKICGLARIVRGFLTPTFENNLLWHERDLTNSSAERFIIPHCFVLTDDILQTMIEIFDNLAVNEQNMKKNLQSTNGLILAESLIIALTKKGLHRENAYELIKKCSMEVSEQRNFKEILFLNKEVAKYLTRKEIENLLKYENYLGKSREVVERVEKIMKKTF